MPVIFLSLICLSFLKGKSFQHLKQSYKWKLLTWLGIWIQSVYLLEVKYNKLSLTKSWHRWLWIQPAHSPPLSLFLPLTFWPVYKTTRWTHDKMVDHMMSLWHHQSLSGSSLIFFFFFFFFSESPDGRTGNINNNQLHK